MRMLKAGPTEEQQILGMLEKVKLLKDKIKGRNEMKMSAFSKVK
tara:strand:- start:271 stop:402 length:132 start_codon:yes stop_codon:yes gene_type:complete